MDVIEQYRFMHEQGHFAGHSLKAHVQEIRTIIQNTQSKHLLDYGCGKAMHHKGAEWGIPVQLYDPAVDMFNDVPEGTFDMVICTDVLEHIPEKDLSAVLSVIFAYARKHVYMTVCTREAKKTLPDGRNAHLTVRPEGWWQDLIGSRHVPYTLKFME